MRKAAFLAFFFLSFSVIVVAQSHDYTNSSCRYFKCPAGENCASRIDGPFCPACTKDREDEKKALREEAKRLEEKVASDKIAKEADIKKQNEESAKKKQAEQDEKQKNVVMIDFGPTKNSPPQPAIPKKTTVLLPGFKGKLYPKDLYKDGIPSLAITNSKGDTILKSTEFVSDRSSNNKVEEMPDNVAVVNVVEEQQSFYPNVHFSPQTLINAKGQRLLKATDINSIQYCRNSLFAVYSGGSTSNYDYSGGGSLAIYDLEKNTLQKVEKTVLPTVNYTNTYGVDMKDYMRMQQLIIYGDPALNTLDYGRYPFNQPACQSLLRGSDWLLFFI